MGELSASGTTKCALSLFVVVANTMPSSFLYATPLARSLRKAFSVAQELIAGRVSNANGGRSAGREERHFCAAFHNISSASGVLIHYTHLRESSEASSATSLPVLRSLSLRVVGQSPRLPPLASSGLLMVSLNFGDSPKGGLPGSTRDAPTQPAQDTKPPFDAAPRSHVYPSQHWRVVGCGVGPPTPP